MAVRAAREVCRRRTLASFAVSLSKRPWSAEREDFSSKTLICELRIVLWVCRKARRKGRCEMGSGR